MVSAPASAVDLVRLKKLYEGNPIAKLAFDLFRRRSKNSTVTSVDRLQLMLGRENGATTRSDIVALFREMEGAGLGEFIVGRAGHASRFQWSVSLISVGRVASGEADTVETFLDDDEVLERTEDPGADEDRRIGHNFRLRPDLTITFTLPVDLTAAEATRIADFVKTLPFSSGVMIGDQS